MKRKMHAPKAGKPIMGGKTAPAPEGKMSKMTPARRKALEKAKL